MNSRNPVSETSKVGSVLVVGGGIGGIQAALDLAESGFKVYVVDSSSAIGGVMAQLDKTFPTNDCAMCTLAPRMVDCGRHIAFFPSENTRVPPPTWLQRHQQLSQGYLLEGVPP